MFLPPNATTYATSSVPSLATEYRPPAATSQEWSARSFGSSEGKRPSELNDEDRHARDQSEGVEAGPAKKPRLPRIAEACIRCKTRKQRCVKDHGEEICKNCAGVDAECIVAPRARRKNTRSKSQSETTGRLSPSRYAAASPSSLQSLLRTDASSSDLTTVFDPFPVEPEPPRPLPLPQSPPKSMPCFPPYKHPAPSLPLRPPPPPAQYYNPMPSPHHAVHSLGHSQPNHTLVPPTSDIRTATPTSTWSGEGDRKPEPHFGPDFDQRPNSNGKAREPDRHRDERLDPARTRETYGYRDERRDSARTSENEDSEGNEAARGVAFLSLNAGGNPIYVGPSSGFSWARLVLGSVAGAARAEGGKFRPTRSRLDTKAPFEAGRPSSAPLLTDDALAGISEELADRVYSIAYHHLQSQFCFMDWLWVRSIFPHRVKICVAAKAPDAAKTTRTAAFFVWMLFALASRLEPTLVGLASSEIFYEKAMDHLETIVGLHSQKNVQALLLMVVYSFRAPSAPSTWFLVGIAVRLCCSLGLHRKLPVLQARRLNPYALQLRRRIFWSAYLMDRMLATSLGRPTSIADEEIDIELPHDCDVDSLTIETPSTKLPTSMSSSLHLINLIRIVSTIRRQVYRLDGRQTKDPSELLHLLSEWETRIPIVVEDPVCGSPPCCTRDWFLSKSFDARLSLLRPLTADSETANSEHLKLVAEFSAEACEIQKRLHQDPIGNLSLESLRTVFLNGLTLLHSSRLSQGALSPTVLQRAIRACSNTLYAYSQQFQGAAAYYDCFEELASLVIDPGSGTLSVSTQNTPLFQTLWSEIPSIMTHETQDSFVGLLDSLGVPFDHSLHQHYDATDIGNDVTYCETGFSVDPFAMGGGLW